MELPDPDNQLETLEQFIDQQKALADEKPKPKWGKRELAFVRTRADQKAKDDGCYVDVRFGEAVVHFFKTYLRHSKGEFAGKPFLLEPWQRDDVVMPLFSWRRLDRTRRFRKAGVWIPKKNGKSAMASGFGLYGLLADGEAGAEIYCVAVDREQAGIVFNEAVRMKNASPGLSGRLRDLTTTKRIIYEAENAFLGALSGETASHEGLNAHMIICDELHAWPNRSLWDVLVYAGAARRQPLMISLSTAGYDVHTIGFEEYQHARAVLDGETDDTNFFAYVAEAHRDADWHDENVWHTSNPNWGVTIKADTFKSDHDEAARSLTKQNVFRRYRLNQWVEQAERWIDVNQWDACADDFELADMEGRECYAGLDLSMTTDTTSLCLTFPPLVKGEATKTLSWFWLPDENLKDREMRDRCPYWEWGQKGLITLIPGGAVDPKYIRSAINDLGKVVTILEVAYDPWGAAQLANELSGEDGFTMVEVRQGYQSMSEPSKSLERMVINKSLTHNGHPILRTHVRNTAVRMDSNANLMPCKKKSTQRIDGTVALIISLSRALLRTEGKSVYESRGLLTVE